VDLIVSFHYLQHALFDVFPSILAAGGCCCSCSDGLEPCATPAAGAPFLLDDGELPTLVRGLDVVRYDEGWLSEGRHEARLLARRA